MPIRLMIVDDHQMLREGLRRSMSEIGFDVIGEASDGDEAVTRATAQRPDVILMDVTMPRMDGVEACRQRESLVQFEQIIAGTDEVAGFFLFDIDKTINRRRTRTPADAGGL